jgi:hypothetical protein
MEGSGKSRKVKFWFYAHPGKAGRHKECEGSDMGDRVREQKHLPKTMRTGSHRLLSQAVTVSLYSMISTSPNTIITGYKQLV